MSVIGGTTKIHQRLYFGTSRIILWNDTKSNLSEMPRELSVLYQIGSMILILLRDLLLHSCKLK